jgi:hypothetical protein
MVNANRITEVTRRNIFDNLALKKCEWWGRLGEIDFLSRLYDLEKLPSTDYRQEYNTAATDIWQHRVNNPGDWSDEWVFYDERFDLLHVPDERFLRFLCEMVHPVVHPDADGAANLVKLFNQHLAMDGWEIAEKMRISEKPVYAARSLLEGAGISIKAAKEMVVRLDADYVTQQITRMESAIKDDPELAIGTAKEFIETICKTILAERGVTLSKDDSLPRLVRLALNNLPLVPEEIQGGAKAEENVRVLLNNLGAVSHHLAELRNQFGTGHGKHANHRGLGSRHARLAVNAASTLGLFLFESHDGGVKPRT